MKEDETVEERGGLASTYDGERQGKLLGGGRTHVKKNVEAPGKFWARVFGIDVGFCENARSAERIPEETVTIRKEF